MNKVFDIWDDELWSTLPARYGDGDGTQDRNDVVVQTALEDVCIELNTSNASYVLSPFAQAVISEL